MFKWIKKKITQKAMNKQYEAQIEHINALGMIYYSLLTQQEGNHMFEAWRRNKQEAWDFMEKTKNAGMDGTHDAWQVIFFDAYPAAKRSTVVPLTPEEAMAKSNEFQHEYFRKIKIAYDGES